MASLTLSNLPDVLYERLAQRASQHGKTVSDEVVRCIELALNAERPDTEAILAEVRALRESNKRVYLTDADLQAAKEDGRA
jgi:plasmid stability protein